MELLHLHRITIPKGKRKSKTINKFISYSNSESQKRGLKKQLNLKKN
jgi:hypothetical protein